MASSLRIALSVVCCAPAVAEGTRLTPVRLTSPVLERTYGQDGGIATNPLVVYENTSGGYYFYYAGPGSRPVVEDVWLADVAHANPFGAWLSRITFGVTQMEQGPSSLDLLVSWYDTVDLDGAPVGEPVNQDRVGPALRVHAQLALNPYFPGAAAWGLSADLSALPGGGVPVADQYFMYEQAEILHEMNPYVYHPGVGKLWSGGGADVGRSGDYFFTDSLPDSDHDGTVELSEKYYFGGPGFAANLFLGFQACIPCDADCNGTVNPFDIAPFIAVLTGSVGCSPCAADSNVDGTANQFDIGAILTCLGA